MSTYTKELEKSIAIAMEFINRTELVLSESKKVDESNAEAKVRRDNGEKYACGFYRLNNVHTSAMRRQSMELTRQLAILRKV